MSVPYKPNSSLLYNIYTLKSLCRAREQLIKEKSKFQVLLTNELDKTFPELKPFFNNNISSTLLYILEKYNWDYTSYTIYPNNEYYRSYNEHSLHNIKGTQKSKSNN